MKYKILIIVNLKSGRGQIEKYINTIDNNLKEFNFDVRIEYTSKNKNATYIIKNYQDEYDVLIICGGDGTLNETIQGLYEIDKKVFVGFIPSGTTNDFARSLKVSFDKLDISKNINKYDSKQVDIGIFNKRVFNYVVTFGIFSKTSYETSVKLKNKIGRLAYFINGIKEIFNYKTYRLKIYSDRNIIEDEFIFGSISNSEYIGGFNLFKKESIKLDDGKFEVILVKKPKNIFQTIRLVLKIMNGNLKDDNIYYFQTSELEIKSFDKIEWSLDGEYGGNERKVKICNQEKYIKYIIPQIKEKEKILEIRSTL